MLNKNKQLPKIGKYENQRFKIRSPITELCEYLISESQYIED